MLNVLYAEDNGKRDQSEDCGPESEIRIPDIGEVVYLQDSLCKRADAEKSKYGLGRQSVSAITPSQSVLTIFV